MSFEQILDLLAEKKEFFSTEDYTKMLTIIQKASKKEKSSNDRIFNNKYSSNDENIEETRNSRHGLNSSDISKASSNIDKSENNNIQSTNMNSQNSDHNTNTAEEYKIEGNAYFKNKQYDEAVFSYTKAIEIDPMNKIYYSNRAAAYANLSMHENGIDDCLTAINLDNKFTKAYIRLGDFYSEFDKDKAIENYKIAHELDPENFSISQKLNMLNNVENDLDKKNVNLKDMMNNPEVMEMVNKMCGNKSKEELEEMFGSLLKRNN